MAILAAALFPVVIRQIDRAAKTAETQNMQAISTNFVMAVLSQKTIPTTANWASTVATFMNQPTSGIATNSRGVPRVYLVDTAGWLGNFAPGYGYAQSTNGATPPTSARVLIVSSIDAANQLPKNLNSGADFNNTWNWDPAVNPALPTSGNWNSWKGSGYDVVIQRINLQPLFHHVVLYAQNPSISYGVANNNGSAASYMATTNNNTPAKVDAYYMDGSVLGLYTNYASAANLQTTELINKDMSRYYFNGAWSDSLGPGPPGPSNSTYTNLDNLAYVFVSDTNAPAGSLRGDNTLGVADWLLAFMTSYSSYASTSPCFDYQGQGNNGKVPEVVMLSDVICCLGNSGQACGGCQIVP